MLRRMMIALVAVCLLPYLTVADEPKTDEAEKKALAAAEASLALMDQQKYGEAWDSSAGYLKNVVGREAYIKALNGVRTPLGKMKSRTLKSKEYRTSLPGAPDGQYVILQFESSLEHKETAVETITPMLDKDGVWRVSGYFIR